MTVPPTRHPEAVAARWLTFLLFFLLTASITRLWLVPLPSSFWVDEMVTAFVVKYPGHHSFDIAPQVLESLYYWLPRTAHALFGFSEIAYRVPSLLCMGLALWLVSRLAVRFIHPQAGWFAAFACLAADGVNYYAIDARPYALGIAVAVGSIFFLVRWFDYAHWADALLFTVCAALLWRVHLIYWPFYLVYVMYGAVRLAKRETAVRATQMLVSGILLTASLLPVVLKTLALQKEAQAHAFAPLPTLRTLAIELHLSLILLCGAAAWAVRRVMPHQLARPMTVPPSFTALVLMAGWWLCAPVCLYLYSQLTEISVFLPRYLSLMLPGVALCATAAAGRSLPAKFWRPAAAVLASGTLLAVGHWQQRWPAHDIYNWRSASVAENRLARSPETPVVVPSPFIEALPPAWTPDYPLPGFLYAQLPFYPITGIPYQFPVVDVKEGESYALRLTAQTLIPSGRFLIYGHSPQSTYWREWFSHRPELAGWTSTAEQFGGVQVAVFQAPRP